MPRRRAPAAVSFVLLLGLFVYLFWVPLRPTAWDGPRGKGPFESDDPPGRRPARPRRPTPPRTTGDLAVTESAARRHGRGLARVPPLLAAGRFAVLWLVLWRIGGYGWLATVGVLAAALPTICGGPRHDESDIGLLLFVMLMAATIPARVSWRLAAVGLPLLFVLWANAHSSVIVGLGWLGAATVGRTVEWWGRRDETAERPAIGRLLVALVLCAAAACLNPDGPQLYADAFRVTKNPNVHHLPAWLPLDFSKGVGMPWGYFVSLAALLLAQLASRRALLGRRGWWCCCRSGSGRSSSSGGSRTGG